MTGTKPELQQILTAAKAYASATMQKMMQACKRSEEAFQYVSFSVFGFDFRFAVFSFRFGFQFLVR